MAFTPPTSADLAARFPRFAAVPGASIDVYLTDAERVVDESWMEGDFAMGRMLYACHLMTLEGLGTGAESEQALAGASGFKVMKSGALTLERFDRKEGSSSLDATSYGSRFKALQRVNKGGPRATGAYAASLSSDDTTDAPQLIAVVIEDKPAAGEVFPRLDLPSARYRVRPDACSASCGTPATSGATFTVTLEGSPVATVTFASGHPNGVFAFTSTLWLGGVLEVTAPDPQDATLADVSITFAGDR